MRLWGLVVVGSERAGGWMVERGMRFCKANEKKRV